MVLGLFKVLFNGSESIRQARRVLFDSVRGKNRLDILCDRTYYFTYCTCRFGDHFDLELKLVTKLEEDGVYD